MSMELEHEGHEHPEQPETQGDGSKMLMIEVQATNYDGRHHWRHPAWLLQHKDGIVQTRTFADMEVSREDGSIYISPYDTRGHYWADRWYNVIRLEIDGALQGYYCNIATPVQFYGKVVGYVDLQL